VARAPCPAPSRQPASPAACAYSGDYGFYQAYIGGGRYARNSSNDNSAARHLLTPLVWHLLDAQAGQDVSEAPDAWMQGQDDLIEEKFH